MVVSQSPTRSWQKLYCVERIVQKRGTGADAQYLVKWLKYPDHGTCLPGCHSGLTALLSENTWEPCATIAKHEPQQAEQWEKEHPTSVASGAFHVMPFLFDAEACSGGAPKSEAKRATSPGPSTRMSLAAPAAPPAAEDKPAREADPVDSLTSGFFAVRDKMPQWSAKAIASRQPQPEFLPEVGPQSSLGLAACSCSSLLTLARRRSTTGRMLVVTAWSSCWPRAVWDRTLATWRNGSALRTRVSHSACRFP